MSPRMQISPELLRGLNGFMWTIPQNWGEDSHAEAQRRKEKFEFFFAPLHGKLYQETVASMILRN